MEAGGIYQRELIEMLGEIADVVSSASVEAVLAGVAARAKRVTDTDKAAIVLADPLGVRLDLDTIVVRGQRAVHLQQWWQDRLEELGDEVFERGVVVESHAEQDAWLLRSPLLTKKRSVGVMIAINSADRPFTREQQDFMAVLSSFAAGAVENARLVADAQTALLASERSRIAAEMHDGAVQSLFAISVGLDIARRLTATDAERAGQEIEKLERQVEEVIADLRRIIHDLKPAELVELGLPRAIEYWIDEVTQGRPVHGRLVVEGILPELSAAQERCLHRVAKESVSNVVRHAKADWLEVRLAPAGGSVRMTIADNGCGFDPSKETADGPDGGVGLRSIRQRVQREGGKLSITSNASSGTTIVVDLPKAEG
ncbi:MAG: histidine kinase [Coriobacteriia bacterium]